MNRTALYLAIGYVALALASGWIYAATTGKFVANSETLLVFGPPRIENATFTPVAGGWNISLYWRVTNPGRLPIRLAIFVWDVVLDNRSDARPWFDGAKLASEYEIPGSLQRDRFTGPVIEPGGSVQVPWWVPNENASANVLKIGSARDPVDSRYYLAVLGGQVVYYVDDISERKIMRLTPQFGRA